LCGDNSLEIILSALKIKSYRCSSDVDHWQKHRSHSIGVTIPCRGAKNNATTLSNLMTEL